MNDFFDIYDLSLFISLKAFLPSLRVLETSQDREEMIKNESVNREKRFVSIFLFNLLKFSMRLLFKIKKYQTFDLEYAGISIPPSWSSLLSSSNPPPRISSMITSTANG